MIALDIIKCLSNNGDCSIRAHLVLSYHQIQVAWDQSESDQTWEWFGILDSVSEVKNRILGPEYSLTVSVHSSTNLF